MKKKYFLAVMLCLGWVRGEMVFSGPGTYTIGDNIFANPIGPNENIIRISSDNVTLNLGNSVISQSPGNAEDGLVGIRVDSGLSNISISGGAIQSISGTGIVVSDNCFNIRVTGIQFNECAQRAISFEGTSGNEIRFVTITGCEVVFGSKGANVDCSLNLSFVNKARVSNCLICDSGNASLDYVACKFSNVLDSSFARIDVIEGSGINVTGIEASNISRCLFKKILLRNNTGNGNWQGFRILGTLSEHNTFEKCSVTRNIASSNLTGFSVETNSQSNIFKNCVVLGNMSSNILEGFSFNGGSSNVKNSLVDCIVEFNNSLNSLIGFAINDADFGEMIRCTGSFNQSSNDESIGCKFEESFASDNWFIQDCKFVKNIGQNDSKSFGIKSNNRDTNFFIGNVAFGNGKIVKNQIKNVSETNLTDLKTKSMNSSNALTNVRVTS